LKLVRNEIHKRNIIMCGRPGPNGQHDLKYTFIILHYLGFVNYVG